MEEEFYATIKLVSGEEVVAKVCYLPEEDKLILDRPLMVETAKQKKGNLEVTGFSLKEWIAATFDEMFIIKRDHIMTMTELDDTIEEFYIKTLKKLEGAKSLAGRGNKLPRRAGYLGSINEMKKSLEDIYKKS
ncbi:MAG: hypothetical protein ACO3CD_08140 [Candidatus Nanopelagicaceae bacterium]